MQPCSVFAFQATTLRNDLAGELKWLESPQVEQGRYAPFARKLRKDIRQIVQELDDLIPDCRTANTLRQSRFASLRLQAANLFGEALTLRFVDFIRTNNLDKGMCSIADKFLAELARAVALELPHITTLAESEFFGVSARVIRLRYPAGSIWDLPVIAHEFGHSFGPFWFIERGQQYPHKRFLESGELGSAVIADEYFCDLLATFLLGPAYPSMCILLRFDPRDSKDGQTHETHPSDLSRAWWVLRGLELLADLAERETATDYRHIANRLRGFWGDYITQSQVADLKETDQLEDSIQRLFERMSTTLRTAAYTDPGPAWGLVHQYRQTGQTALAPGRLRDLLNATWFARLERENDFTDLTKAAHIDKWACDLARSAAA